MYHALILTLALIWIISCKSDTGFHSSNEKKELQVLPYATPFIPQPVPSYLPMPTPNCSEGRFTEAKLVTRTLTNKKTPQSLEYELSISDCNGPQKVTSSQVLFDIKYSFSSNTSGYDYEVRSSLGKFLGKGTMQVVEGSDLFGKNEPGFSHFKTDEVQIIESDTYNIRLIIDFSGREFVKSEYNSTDDAQTFLKFGNANVSKQGEQTKVHIFNATPQKSP